MSSRKLIIYNIITLVLILIAIEGVSLLIFKLHSTLNKPDKPNNEEISYEAYLKEQRSAQYISDIAIFDDHTRFKEDNYLFKSFLMYHNKPFQSRFVNVNERGIRENGNAIEKEASRDYHIWAFGSSALFGDPANADYETMPAYLEAILNKTYPDINFIVTNYGANSYTSIQEYLLFKLELTRHAPDMVITFDGYNDYCHIFADKIFKAYIGHNELKGYWNLHQREGIINSPMLIKRFSSLMPNTKRLIKKGRKLIRLVNARRDIEGWKSDYIAKAEAASHRQSLRMDLGLRAYLENIEMIILACKERNIPVIIMQQPALIASHKDLLGHERVDLKGLKLNHFAVDQDRLMAQEGINTRWLDNDNMWNLSLFTKGYSLMNEMLYNLSLEHNAGYLNAQAIVDDMGKKAVYYDSVHLTAIANEVLAEELSKEVSRYIE